MDTKEHKGRNNYGKYHGIMDNSWGWFIKYIFISLTIIWCDYICTYIRIKRTDPHRYACIQYPYDDILSKG